MSFFQTYFEKNNILDETQPQNTEQDFEFFSKIINDIYSAIIILEVEDNFDFSIFYMNKGVELLTGYNLNEITLNPDLIMLNSLLKSKSILPSIIHGQHEKISEVQKIICKNKTEKYINFQFKKLEFDNLNLVLVFAVDSSKKIINTYLLEEEIKAQKKYIAELKMSKLTTTERLIFENLAKGKSISEIAKSEYKSYYTIETHKRNIFKKLGFSKINDLIKFAHEIK